MPFTCTLCDKTYARYPELQSHENSYDHQHRKRLKDMKTLTRNNPAAASDRRARARRDDDIGLLGGNRQEVVDWRETARRSDAAEAGAGLGPGGAVRLEGAAEEQQEEEKWVLSQGAVPWEALDGVEEVVDLDSQRPGEMQRVVAAGRAHAALRGDEKWFEELWRGIGDSHEREPSERESMSGSASPPGAVGLGY